MPSLFIYVVDRDFGFAPNPFHGTCTLATCKPRIRNAAQINDWVIGVGGTRLNATGKCIFSMKVTRKISFDEYWQSKEFIDKRPIRNGSRCRMVGDNIYHYDVNNQKWIQEDSHHSKDDGTTNLQNLSNDTSSRNVLVSDWFYYFGKEAPDVTALLLGIGYVNHRNHRRFDFGDDDALMESIKFILKFRRNYILGDPMDFDNSHHRYDGETNTSR